MDTKEEEDTKHTQYTTELGNFCRGLALGISYWVNKSLLWALFHGLLGPIYLGYFLAGKMRW